MVLHPILKRPVCGVGEDKFGVVPLQRPQDTADRSSDREDNAPSALPQLNDLARSPVDLTPFQSDAFLLTHSCGPYKVKERRMVSSRGRVDTFRLIIMQFA